MPLARMGYASSYGETLEGFVSQTPSNEYVFRVPPLRNIELTPQEDLRWYHRGIWYRHAFWLDAFSKCRRHRRIPGGDVNPE